MKITGNIPEIIEYVRAHPGCSMSAIIKDLGIKKVSVAPALTNLIKDGRLARSHSSNAFRYFCAKPKPKPAAKKRHNGDEVNPLTKMFNEHLASVRGGRAEV